MAEMTPLKAIRAKCIDCSCGSSREATNCTLEKCPLWIYRTGHNPKRKGVGNLNVAFAKNKTAVGENIEKDI